MILTKDNYLPHASLIVTPMQVGRMTRLFVVAILTTFSGSIFQDASTGINQSAYGDGLHSELLPPVLVNGQQLSLYAKMQPTFITEGNRSNVTLQLRLIDSPTNQTIDNVTYVIFLGRFDPAAELGVRPLLNDAFFSEDGPLTLNIVPTDDDRVEADSSKRPPLDAWSATGPLGAVNYRTPQVFDGGLYYVGVVIAGLNDPDVFFPPEIAPNFVAGLSIGYATENTIVHSGKVQNVTIVSYYDKISNFAFDQRAESFSWSMPFDWDSEKIASKNILVHHEIRLPKSISTIADAATIEGSINGERLAGKNIALDPFSSEEHLTIHYILNKPDILAMSQQIDPLTTRDMNFRLFITPANDTSSSDVENTERTETVLITDGSGIQATIGWDQVTAAKPSNMTINFSDVLTQAPINADINYDLKILDANGNEHATKSDLIAKSGSDNQEVLFPTNERYYIEIDVKGFLVYSIDDAERSSPTLDTTRAGIARGTVVVPEFPYTSILIIIGALFGASVVFNNKLSRKLAYS